MKRAALMLILALAAGCRQTLRDPEAYLRAVMEHPVSREDGPFVYKINQLTLDYFLAREVASADSVPTQDRAVLKGAVKARHGDARYFMLRIGLDSCVAGNPAFQEEMATRMRFLQSNQELARREISGVSKGKEGIHPDLFLIDSDWIGKQGLSILFSFRQEDADGMTGIEFGKSFVRSRNLLVDVKSLEPNFRFKG